MGVPPYEKECSKEGVKSFIQGSSGSLSSFSPVIWFLFSHLTYPGVLPKVHTHLSAKRDPEVKASGRSKTHYGLESSPDFDSKDFLSGSDGKASAYNVGDAGSIPGSGRSPGEGNGNPLQYSCLEYPMDRGSCWATVHGVAKSRTRLSDFTSLLTPKSLAVCVESLLSFTQK